MKKKIIIAGGTGLIGTRLIELLDKDHYNIYVLTRSNRNSSKGVNYVQWDVNSKHLPIHALNGTYAVINLAGAGIADERWTEQRKETIINSRIKSTETLNVAIKELKEKPEVYIGASAIGYYGENGDEKIDESTNSGQGFLSEVCEKWEAEHFRLEDNFKRLAILRIGIVLSTQGGALKEILKTSAAGIYGYFGDGSTFYSWIHIDDLCRIIIYLLENQSTNGVFNATVPVPVTIKRLVTAVKKAKASFGIVVPVPVFSLRLMLGEMAQMLVTSMRVIPKKLLDTDFEFRFTDPVEAIRDLLEKKN